MYSWKQYFINTNNSLKINNPLNSEVHLNHTQKFRFYHKEKALYLEGTCYLAYNALLTGKQELSFQKILLSLTNAVHQRKVLIVSCDGGSKLPQKLK